MSFWWHIGIIGSWLRIRIVGPWLHIRIIGPWLRIGIVGPLLHIGFSRSQARIDIMCPILTQDGHRLFRPPSSLDDHDHATGIQFALIVAGILFWYPHSHQIISFV